MLEIVSPDILSFFFLLFAASFLLMFVPYWVIVTKAGFSGWWCLLMLVPVVGVIAPWILLFQNGPRSDVILRQRRKSRLQNLIFCR